MHWPSPPSAPRARTPTSGVLVEALFLLAALTGAAMSAMAIAGRGRASGPADTASAPRAPAPERKPGDDGDE